MNIQTNFEKFQIWKCFKKIYSNLSQFDFSSNSVQKYFKPLIFESKILFKIKKKVYAATSLAFGPFRRSAHFRLSFTPTEIDPLCSAFWPSTLAPTSGHATVPCAADCRPPPRAKSQIEALSCRLHFPHWIGVVPSPLPPLTPLKPTRSKTPPPLAASPPPHGLPGPIKITPPPPLRTTLAATLLRSSPRPQSPNTEHHRCHLLLFTIGLTPPLPRSRKHAVRTSKIPLSFSAAAASSLPLHHRRARTLAKLRWRSVLGSTVDQSVARSTGCGPSPPAFLVEKQFYFL
jgi:hypothetical protein